MQKLTKKNGIVCLAGMVLRFDEPVRRGATGGNSSVEAIERVWHIEQGHHVLKNQGVLRVFSGCSMVSLMTQPEQR